MEFEKLIVFEGLNGSGKATQTKLLVDYLKSKNNPVETIEFPIYDSVIGKLIKDYLSEKKEQDTYFISLMYELDRFQVRKKMLDILNEGKYLILDRYFYSNLTFQKVLAQDQNFMPWIKCVQGPLPKPKYKIYLKMPLEYTIENMKNKKKDWHEQDLEFMQKVYDEYIELTKDWIIIECVKNNSLRTIDDIHNEVVLRLNL
jgi:dTMP kinase